MARTTKVDRLLDGEPIIAAGHTIRPLARLHGWTGGSSGPHGAWGGSWLCLTPVAAIVRRADGSETCVPIADARREALRGIVATGLLAAGLCATMMTIRTFIQERL